MVCQILRENAIETASTDIRTFNPSGHTDIDMDIRVVDFDGEPWFVASDVCKALGVYVYGKKVNSSMALRKLDKTEKKVEGVNRIAPSAFDRRMKTVALISESGLYKLVMRSDKPQARAFQDWVTKVVLPSDLLRLSHRRADRTGSLHPP